MPAWRSSRQTTLTFFTFTGLVTSRLTSLNLVTNLWYRWDFTTPIEEVMHALNDWVVRGKVLYLGVSDVPAWIVSQANQCKGKSWNSEPQARHWLRVKDARDHGLRPFVLYQGRWSASYRDMEREIIPMCRAQGMGICPWGALSRGHLKSEAERESRKANPEGRNHNFRPASEADIQVSKVVEGIANSKGKSVQAIVRVASSLHLTLVLANSGCRLWHGFTTRRPMCFQLLAGARLSISAPTPMPSPFHYQKRRWTQSTMPSPSIQDSPWTSSSADLGSLTSPLQISVNRSGFLISTPCHIPR